MDIKQTNNERVNKMTKNKIPFDKIDQSVLQDIGRTLVSNHVYSGQSMLVDELMKKEVINIDDYENKRRNTKN